MRISPIDHTQPPLLIFSGIQRSSRLAQHVRRKSMFGASVAARHSFKPTLGCLRQLGRA